MPLYPGKPVLYRFRPGAVRMGQTEAAAMITRVYPDGTCDLTVHPPNNPDPLFQNKVPKMANGDDFHCWRLNDDEHRMEELERRVAELEFALHQANINTASQNAIMEENRSSAIAAERKRNSRTKATETA